MVAAVSSGYYVRLSTVIVSCGARVGRLIAYGYGYAHRVEQSQSQYQVKTESSFFTLLVSFSIWLLTEVTQNLHSTLALNDCAVTKHTYQILLLYYQISNHQIFSIVLHSNNYRTRSNLSFHLKNTFGAHVLCVEHLRSRQEIIELIIIIFRTHEYPNSPRYSSVHRNSDKILRIKKPKPLKMLQRRCPFDGELIWI